MLHSSLVMQNVKGGSGAGEQDVSNRYLKKVELLMIFVSHRFKDVLILYLIFFFG